jgi:hypothetical protein
VSLKQDARWKNDPAAWLRERHRVTPDPWQERFLRSQSRRIILNCCRQAGKSTAVGWRVAHRASFIRGYFAVCTAPSDRQSLELFQKIRKTLDAAGELEVPPTKDNLHELVLPNGSRIVCLPSNADTIRGFSAVDELLVDEAAMVGDAVFAAVEPMVIRSGGSMVLMSTPLGQRGHFHSVWAGGHGWERYEVSYVELLKSGHFEEEELKAYRAEHGDWKFRQEYCCEFVASNDSVFTSDVIAKATCDDEPFDW